MPKGLQDLCVWLSVHNKNIIIHIHRSENEIADVKHNMLTKHCTTLPL